MNSPDCATKGKVVLTGGPSAGKTTIANAIERSFVGQTVKIPEAATILFGGGFFRSKNPAGVAFQQKAIYQVQSSHEAIYAIECPNRFFICDRGTLDGYAYWPEGEADFFEANNTTLEKELARYDLVIHLDSANGNNYDFTNSIRTESPEEALVINNRVKEVWKEHPNRKIIPADESFSVKVAQVLDIMERFISRR